MGLSTAGAQANFLSRKRRLTARRLDWLVHVIYDQVVEKYLISQHIMDSGVAINRRAYHATSAAILKAKECADSAVSISGSHAQVPSRSVHGTVHSVTVIEGADEPPTCSCQAIGQCWHQVKVLMLRGATEGQLLQFIGERYGTAAGGYAALWQAMMQRQQEQRQQAQAQQGERRQGQELSGGDTGVFAELVSGASGPPPLEQEAAPMDVDTADPLDTAAEQQRSSGLPGKSAKQLAHAAAERLLALGADWDEESPKWGHVTYQLSLALNGVEKALSAPDMAALQYRHTTLACNPDAPAGNSTKRFVSWQETCSSSQQRPTAASGDSQHLWAAAMHVQPFVTEQRPLKKPASELAHIERMLSKVPAPATAAAAARGAATDIVGKGCAAPMLAATAAAHTGVLPCKAPRGPVRRNPAATVGPAAASSSGARSSGRSTKNKRPARWED